MTESPVRTTKTQAPDAAPQDERRRGTSSCRRPMIQQPPTAMIDGSRGPPVDQDLAQPRVPFEGDGGRTVPSTLATTADQDRCQRQGNRSR